MADEIDPAVLQERSRESVAKIKEMTDDLRSVLLHERHIAGDLLQSVEDKDDSKP